jgi:hypothetical protein
MFRVGAPATQLSPRICSLPTLVHAVAKVIGLSPPETAVFLSVSNSLTALMSRYAGAHTHVTLLGVAYIEMDFTIVA